MKKQFGFTPENRPASLFTLENDNFIASISDYGATLVSLIDKKSGTEIVAGFDNVEGYANHTAHFGATIGRVANRIRGAEFLLNGKTYHVTPNRAPNSLHGGEKGFDRLLFSGEEDGNKVVFTALSPDGDEGYPGNLQIRVVYTLLENGIRIECTGLSDEDTLFGITNHSYFNLSGSGTIDDHRVKINGDFFAPNFKDGCSDGSLVSCDGSPFDFRQEKEVGSAFEDKDPQIVMTGGIDHHYSIPGNGMREMASCRANGLKLTTRSDLPGIHFYTGNFLNGNYTGHNGVSYDRHERLCFEPEFYPNAINYEGHEKPVLKAGVPVTQTIEYLLEADPE